MEGEVLRITGSSTHNQRIQRFWRDLHHNALCHQTVL